MHISPLSGTRIAERSPANGFSSHFVCWDSTDKNIFHFNVVKFISVLLVFVSIFLLGCTF